MIIKHIEGFFKVKLSWIAEFVSPVVVIETVSAVAALLYLADEVSCTDSMDSARRDEENISRLCGVEFENVHDGIVSDTLSDFFPAHILLEAHIKACIWLRVNDVPHFSLAAAVFMLHGIFVIGMHLNGKILLCINKFYKERELPVRVLFRTQCGNTDLFKVFREKHTFELTACDP